MEPVRLVRVPLASTLTAEQALLTLRDDERPVALTGAWAGGGAILASDPVRIARPDEDPFALLAEQPRVEGSGAERDGRPVGGGWFGTLGYALGARLEPLPPSPPRPVPVPAFSLAFYDHVLRLDRRGGWWFEALESPASAPRLRARLATLRDRLAGPAPAPAPYRLAPFAPRPGPDGHEAAVRACRRHIAAGDLYQANLTLRLESRIDGAAIDLFASAAGRLRPARAAFVGDPDRQVASLSPELFLERRGRRVRTAPIKGTVARTGDPAGDEQALHALADSAKDRAENVMIVDLMRNDLGRCCEYGTVAAAHLARPEAHAGVWHLVSEVTGELRPGVGDDELLRATFPPGSVTGAPKIKAMEVIAELESTGREAYTGAIGFASPVAGLELNVAIRTFEVAGDRVWLGAGGGVVADSSPAGEYEECLVKARPLLAAAGAALRPTQRRPTATATARPPVRHPRPDPAAGVFETVLAVDGRPVEPDAHARRLEASAHRLYGARPPGVREAIERAAAEVPDGLARVRVEWAPSAGRPHRDPASEPRAGAATATPIPDAALPSNATATTPIPDAAPLPAATATPIPDAALLPAAAVAPEPLTLPGGLGEHKWLDRRLLQSAGAEPLIVDLDGTVLESGSGNVFAIEGDALVTPPADGRILPGVTRAALLRLAPEAGLTPREEPLTLDRLHSADAVFLASSVRLLQPAYGTPPAALAPLARALCRRWRLPVPALA
ncbi:MAG TPA: aminodeoxychorismate synthase component I [Solirubrobacteraceae bacterium]|nr:aminodeoxychorismate synthase component I [Solirubrobacteraceae bacterium]